MPDTNRIYLDNAATSWPKPESVYAAVDDYQRRLGAPAGRGAYATGQEVERLVADARRQIATLIGAKHPQQIAFAASGTDAICTAFHGIVCEGDHIVTTVAEHNSVLRPLRWLEKHWRVRVTYVGVSSEGIVDPEDVTRAILPTTALIALTHASNVTGALQPVAEIARIARRRDIPLLVDACQSLGHVPLDVTEMGIDMLAASGHKGLLGPLGTGLFYHDERLTDRIESLRQGGTGTSSEDDNQPSDLPYKFEAGNLNVPGILGLGAGVSWIAGQSLENLRQHERRLTSALWQGLSQISGVTLYGPADSQKRVGVVSLSVAGYEPQEVALMLDSSCDIEVRAGLHCAPRMHEALGTKKLGGTVRMSVGPFSSSEQMDTAIEAVAQLASTSLPMTNDQ